MARERYLLNAGDDTIHAGEIRAETTEEKRKNWWDYHKGHVIAGCLALALVVSLFVSIFCKVKPDYTVALLTSYSMPENGINELERCISAYAEDRNKDGETVVEIVNYVVSGTTPSTPDDANMQQASLAKFAADCTSNDSMIFLSDDAAFAVLEENFSGFFLYNDGSAMPAEASDYENARLAWPEFAAFSAFAPETEEGDSFDAAALSKLYGKLKVSIRAAQGTSIEKKEKDMAYYNDSLALYERLKNGEQAPAAKP